MRSHRIVVLPPSFDDGLGFLQRVEDLAIEQFVTKLRVEALNEARRRGNDRWIVSFTSSIPRASWRDVGRLGLDCRDPFLNRLAVRQRASWGMSAKKDDAAPCGV
jgi:hypothetical protein